MSTGMLTAGGLLDVACYSDDIQIIVGAVKDSQFTSDEYVFASCLHAVGHLARRFRYFDDELYLQLLQRAENFLPSEVVRGAVIDMKDDLKTFITPPRSHYFDDD